MGTHPARPFRLLRQYQSGSKTSWHPSAVPAAQALEIPTIALIVSMRLRQFAALPLHKPLTNILRVDRNWRNPICRYLECIAAVVFGLSVCSSFAFAQSDG